MKIVAVEPIGITSERAQEIKEIFKSQNVDFEVYKDRQESPEVLVERMRNADAVIVSNIPIKKEIMEKCPKLKMLMVAFTGLDHIDLEYCRQHNIVVRNAAGYATTAVAELAVGLMLDCYRHLTVLDAQIRNGGTRNNFLGRQLKGKVVGIVGTGAIGMETARLLLAFGCKVVAWSRSERKELTDLGVRYLSLEMLMAQSDIISLHLPLTPQTHHIITRDLLSLCKPSALIVNTARGNVVDINAVAEMLSEGKIAGAAFDVFEKEPPLAENHPLLRAPNCLVIPHVGYATREAFDIRIDICIETLLNEIASLK